MSVDIPSLQAAGTGRRHPPGRRNAKGMAISLILTAIALVVALGIALTYAMRAGSAVSESNAQSLLATTLVNQAASLKAAIIITHAKNGQWPEYVHFNTAWFNQDWNGSGVFNPVDGAAESATPPAGSVTGSSTGWRWLGDGWVADTWIPGLPQGEWLLSLSYVQPGVCAQINKILTGSTNIPVVTRSLDLQTISGWNDLTGDTNATTLNGYYEICFKDNRGVYQYYKAALDDNAN